MASEARDNATAPGQAPSARYAVDLLAQPRDPDTNPQNTCEMSEPSMIETKQFSGILSFSNERSIVNCPVCRCDGLHVESPYPASNEPKFRGACVLWCMNCGSGHVPQAESLLNGYYGAEYAESNRGDRTASPDEYFSELTREHSRYAHYALRAFTHAFMIRRHGGSMQSVLDYGSGPGYFLYLSGGTKRYAVEPDAYSQ